VSVEEQLLAAHEAAGAHAEPGEQVLAVLPAEPGRGRTVFLAAYGPPGGTPTYLALDGDHRPVADRQLVKDAVTMLALAELAEEASGAVAADDLRGRFQEAGRVLAGRPQAEAADAVVAALDRVSETAAGPRIATPLLLDRLAAAAGDLAAAVDTFELALDELGGELAAAGADPVPLSPAWEALAALAAHADPSAFSQTLAGTTGPVEALVDEVVERYRMPLV
jgi:hypothetical protein